MPSTEDLPEDLARGTKTTTVVLGLKTTLTIALTMFVAGSAVFLMFWGEPLLAETTSVWSYVAFIGLCVACLYVFVGMKRLTYGVRSLASEDTAISMVKAHGKLVPVWATMIGWIGLMCGVSYQLLR